MYVTILNYLFCFLLQPDEDLLIKSKRCCTRLSFTLTSTELTINSGGQPSPELHDLLLEDLQQDNLVLHNLPVVLHQQEGGHVERRIQSQVSVDENCDKFG